MSQPGGIPAEKHRRIVGIATVQLLGVSSKLRQFKTDVFADSGYQGVGQRQDTQDISVNCHVAMQPGKRVSLDKDTPMGAIMDKLERTTARIRAKSNILSGWSSAGSGS